ncbi:carbon-nitrogen hydrolase family protein [Dehalococcoidia bacterium]|nr:carbon-nitrogen hydrolase family protein [Dehalococcoidia bacterium]
MKTNTDDNPSKEGGFLPASCDSESDTFKVALVVPEVWAPNSGDISSYPQATSPFQPTIPGELDFGGEDIDLVIFPEAYIRSEDNPRLELLRTLSERLKAHLLVGATKRHDGRDADWETLILFDPSGDYRTLYHKHATAGAVAFENPDWEPETQLPIFKIRHVNIGCTICHDSYLGLLQRYLAQRGAQIWINPSYDNVIHEKWESIHRLRGVENQIVSLCTLHDNLAKKRRRRIRPFGFRPDGAELTGYLVGKPSQARNLSECTISGIYIVKCPIDSPPAVTNPELLPKTFKQPFLRQRRGHLIRVALIQSLPHVWCENRWVLLKQGELVDINGVKLGIGIIPGDKLFDIPSFVQLQESIYNLNPGQAKPIFWNQWSELPTEPSRLVDIMTGRTLEMFAPVVLSDRQTIYEVTEIAGGTKTMRRISVNSNEAEVDVKFALGIWNSFKITWDRLTDIAIPEAYFKPFVNKYLSLI